MTFSGEWTVRFSEEMSPFNKVWLHCVIVDNEEVLGGYTILMNPALLELGIPEAIAHLRETALRGAIEDAHKARLQKEQP